MDLECTETKKTKGASKRIKYLKCNTIQPEPVEKIIIKEEVNTYDNYDWFFFIFFILLIILLIISIYWSD